MTARLGVLLSGRGSNFVALQESIATGNLQGAEIVTVLSNLEEAPGLKKAGDLGLSARAIPHKGHKRREHDRLMVEALREAEVDWVCLAGYMRLLTPVFTEAFPQRILNIHPSLLPAFPGLDAQRQAWEYGVTVSGCTVHLVDEGMDTGPIVGQSSVDISECGEAGDVSRKILAAEHQLYSEALSKLIHCPWEVVGRRVVFGN